MRIKTPNPGDVVVYKQRGDVLVSSLVWVVQGDWAGFQHHNEVVAVIKPSQFPPLQYLGPEEPSPSTVVFVSKGGEEITRLRAKYSDIYKENRWWSEKSGTHADWGYWLTYYEDRFGEVEYFAMERLG